MHRPIDDPTLASLLAAFCAEQDLPLALADSMRPLLRPLTVWLAGLAAQQPCPVIGVQGLQGSGKSTLAALLPRVLDAGWGLRTAVLSLDDFYLGRQARETLAQNVHPLLRTRGVPGTHEVALALDTLTQLQALAPGACVHPPRFDKARDDRRAPQAVGGIEGPVDLILFEGWCMGLAPETEAALQTPVNALEALEDADGRWRRHVNRQLAGDYRQLWARLDRLIVMQAPSFEVVAAWRGEQERRTAREAGGDAPGLMDEAALQRFLQHYERLSRHALASLPAQADLLLGLDTKRRMRATRYPEDFAPEYRP